MKRTITLLLSSFVLLVISGCNGKQECVPTPPVILNPHIEQVEYPKVTNYEYNTTLDYAFQCTNNYFMMQEAFLKCQNNALPFK